MGSLVSPTMVRLSLAPIQPHHVKWKFSIYLGPLPALSSLIEGYTPPTPVATPRVGSKIPTI